MKRYIALLLIASLCVMSAASLASCGSSENSPTEAPPAETTPAETTPLETVPGRQSYQETWLDKATAVHESNVGEYVDEFIISDIYAECFFARADWTDCQYKFNGSLPAEWCVDDHVYIGYKNLYRDEKAKRCEADLTSVTEMPAYNDDAHGVYKPVIYLYPERETQVSVKLAVDGELVCTYPAYGDGWTVTAQPDGTLSAGGKEYNYLYWEALQKTKYDFSRGYCVRGEDTAAFLEEALAKLGLTRREANEFIVYWLAQMQDNPYNVIAFQGEAYTEAARLDITPAPDTLIRVFMAWYPVEAPVELPAQELSAPQRAGFTAVEWGGAKVG